MQDETQKKIITRVTPSLAMKIEKAAEAEALSVAAYVRRLLKLALTEGQPRVVA